MRPASMISKIRSAMLSAMLLASSACAASSAPAGATSDGRLAAIAAAPATPARPGLHPLRTGARATLYIPVSAANGPAPFLILLHGAGGGSDGMIRRFRDEADRRGIILFAPESAASTWDAVLEIGRGREPAFGQDVARIDTALAEAFARANADPKRIGIAGFSDGAGYALSLGVRNSSVFSAVFGFSPGMIVPGDTGPPTHVFISHGEKDRVLPISVPRDTLVPLLKQARFDVTFVTFNGGHELPDDVLRQALDGWLGAP
jgi:phospholipase/carboxylesterase